MFISFLSFLNFVYFVRALAKTVLLVFSALVPKATGMSAKPNVPVCVVGFLFSI